MSVNVSNAAGRTHDRTGGQVYIPASQDIAGHGSGGRTSRPANCEWAALLVATGPGPLLGKNGGGATATHGVLLPRVIPSAAPGFEEPAADRGRVCHRQRYCQPGVYRGNWRWPKLQAAQVYGSGGFRCGRRSCDASLDSHVSAWLTGEKRNSSSSLIKPRCVLDVLEMKILYPPCHKAQLKPPPFQNPG